MLVKLLEKSNNDDEKKLTEEQEENIQQIENYLKENPGKSTYPIYKYIKNKIKLFLS